MRRRQLADHLDGRAIPINPGQHECRAEMEGAPPQVERIMVAEGEMDKLWRVSFQHAPTSPRHDDAGVAPPPPPKSPRRRRRRGRFIPR